MFQIRTGQTRQLPVFVCNCQMTSIVCLSPLSREPYNAERRQSLILFGTEYSEVTKNYSYMAINLVNLEF